MEPRHIGAIFADILEEAGIEFVFGMPGGCTPFLFDGLVDRTDRINTVLVRHEGGAAVMADLHARITGKPAVVMGQGPWIGGSGGYGLLESLFSGLPVVVIADTSDYYSLPLHGPYQNGTGDYGSFDLLGIIKSMTKYATLATNASEFIHGLKQAIKHSLAGKPGPTAVVLKWNVAFEMVDLDAITPKVHPLEGLLNVSPPCISREDAGKAADMLLTASAPVIVAGQGVRTAKAYDELRELAELLGLPVATSYLGKSAIPETHDCAVGTMGSIGQALANRKIKDADVILAVGSALSPENTKWMAPDFINPANQKIIQIDIDSRNAAWTYPVDLGVTSDARLALQAVIAAIKTKTVPFDATSRINALKAAKIESKTFNEDIIHSDETPIAPERVVKAVMNVLMPEDILILDAGNSRMWFTHHFQSKSPGQILAGGGVAAIGYSASAALSAKLTMPDKRVLAMCGDGGLVSQLYALEMARDMQMDVTYAVLNNSCLGNVRDFQPEDRRIATCYSRTDFASIARGFGLNAATVKTPEEIEPALNEALGSKEPYVIDIWVDDAAHFRMMT
jgi:acetolactate synthase-1/2/3 large subunit